MQCWKLSRNTGYKHLMIQVMSTNQITEFMLTQIKATTCKCNRPRTRSVHPQMTSALQWLPTINMKGGSFEDTPQVAQVLIPFLLSPLG